ncbi:MAG: hypothetical protein MK135_07585 [Polyangiaceae bacterium]|nr:hypothetical protein [Polyangiaceae bacterium]
MDATSDALRSFPIFLLFLLGFGCQPRGDAASAPPEAPSSPSRDSLAQGVQSAPQAPLTDGKWIPLTKPKVEVSKKLIRLASPSSGQFRFEVRTPRVAVQLDEHPPRFFEQGEYPLEELFHPGEELAPGGHALFATRLSSDASSVDVQEWTFWTEVSSGERRVAEQPQSSRSTLGCRLALLPSTIWSQEDLTQVAFLVLSDQSPAVQLKYRRGAGSFQETPIEANRLYRYEAIQPGDVSVQVDCLDEQSFVLLNTQAVFTVNQSATLGSDLVSSRTSKAL